MNARAWYLGCGPEDVGDRAVLVGDRGRVATAAKLLSEPRWLNDERGLTTVTGTREGQRVTVSAFGMGAPVAAVVLHELASIGVRSFVRLGTALTLPPARLGDLVLADGAVRGESTSATYLPLEFPALPDPGMVSALGAAAGAVGRRCVRGLIASYDGFYTQIFTARAPEVPAENRGGAVVIDPAAAEPGGETAEAGAPAGTAGTTATATAGTGPPPGRGGDGSAAARMADLARLGVVGVDMETSAIFVVAHALGVRAASMCLGTVDGLNHDRLPREARADAELALLEVGMRGLLEAG